MIQTLSTVPSAEAHAVRYGACLALGFILGLGLSLASLMA